MNNFKITKCHWRRQVFSYHPSLGWWWIPGLRARIPNHNDFYLLRTNKAGFRSDREYPLQKPQGRKRIILLGDSYTAGDGVSNGERYSDLIEAAYPHLDVMNFAISGSGTDQQVLIYEEIARQYEADAVVFAILVENIIRNGQTCRPGLLGANEKVVYFRPKPYFVEEEGRLVLKNQPVPVERRTYDQLENWSCPTPHINEAYIDEQGNQGPLWRLMKQIIARFLSSAGSIPVYFLVLPIYTHILEEWQPVYRSCFDELRDEKNHRYIIDPLDDFLALPMQERNDCMFTNDPHYTQKAHRLISRSLIEEIKKYQPDLLAG